MQLLACPCLHTTPCHDRCTCVTPLSSSGCRRCCTYGSAEQRSARARRLAALIDGTAPSKETAMRRVAAVLNDRKGYHVDDLDDATRDDFLGALVEAVRAEVP
jgi:hypothetical protein